MRAKLLRAKKDAYHLEKALNKGRHEVLERGARVPSVGSFLDAAEGKLPKEGRRDSRVCSNQSGGRSIGAKGKSTKRPAPTGMVAGLGSIAALDAKGERVSGKRHFLFLFISFASCFFLFFALFSLFSLFFSVALFLPQAGI